jgi:hypothetical protein
MYVQVVLGALLALKRAGQAAHEATACYVHLAKQMLNCKIKGLRFFSKFKDFFSYLFASIISKNN